MAEQRLNHSQSSWILRGLILITVVVVGYLLLTHTTLYPTNSDSVGYIYAGQLISAGNGPHQYDAYNQSINPYFYLHSFRNVRSPNTTEITYGYPPGYSFLIAIFIILFQYTNIEFYVVAITAILSIIATYKLGKIFAEEKWVGIFALFIFISTNIFWEFSTSPWSEIPSLLFITSGIWFYIKSYQSLHTQKLKYTWALLAGFVLGYSFFIRFTNLLLIMPAIFIFELWFINKNIWVEKSRWLFWSILTASVLMVLGYNWYFIGGPFHSIYSTLELGAYPWSMFSLTYAFGPSPIHGFSVQNIVETLWANFGLFLVGIIPGWYLFKHKKYLIFAIGIPLSTLFLYSIYAFPATGINSRFLLPSFPFLAIAIANFFVVIGKKLPNIYMKWILSFALIAILLFNLPASLAAIQERNVKNENQTLFVQNLVSSSAQDSVWLSSNYNDLIIIYGKRSAFNYRRILKADPASRKFNMEQFRGCIVESTDKLLAQNIPVYYIEESSWGIDDIITEYYELESVGTTPVINQIVSQKENLNRDSLSICKP